MDEIKALYPHFRRGPYGLYLVWPDPRAIAFGLTFRRARTMAGWSQRRLAGVTGVSQSMISRLERGMAPGMSLERLIILSDAVGVRMPLGFCPHAHDCAWGRIMPTTYAPESDGLGRSRTKPSD